MTWEAIGTTLAVGGVLNAVMLLAVRYEIQKSNEDLRKWINGSFMRAALVEEKTKAFERRLELLEDKD